MSAAQSEQVSTFECKGNRLIGIAHLPLQEKKKLGVIIVVGGPQYRVGSHRQFVLMARAFAAGGFPTLRFDYLGMGDSEGQYRGFEFVAEDIAAAVTHLLALSPELNGVVLCGLCDSASACLIYTNQSDPRIKGLLLLNPETRTEVGEAAVQLKHYYFQRFMQKSFWTGLLTGQVKIWTGMTELASTLAKLLSGRTAATEPGKIGFVDRMYSGFAGFSRPILFLISGRDITARVFEDLCRKDPQWSSRIGAENMLTIACQDADHTFSRRSELDKANQHVLQWLQQIAA